MSDTKSDSTDVWTVARILEWTTKFLKDHGSDTPRLDAQILLAHVRKCSRIQLYTSFDVPLSTAERAQMRDLVKRRANAEPVAYLVGHREFFGLDFHVNKNVLIPRPDTETLLVEFFDLTKPRNSKDDSALAIELATGVEISTSAAGSSSDRESQIEGDLPGEGELIYVPIAPPTAEIEVAPALVNPAQSKQALKDQLWAAPVEVLDLCTGSGCIAITIASQLKQASVTATDVSDLALEVARSNAQRLGVFDRVRFLQGDLFSTLSPERQFDFIVSNPPYVPTGEIASLDADVRNHEPHLALDGGPTGMQFLQPIVAKSKRFLRPQGWLLVETGIEQAPLTLELIERDPDYTGGRIVKDLAGRPRVVLAKRI